MTELSAVGASRLVSLADPKLSDYSKSIHPHASPLTRPTIPPMHTPFCVV
jgi:hypothetical protein